MALFLSSRGVPAWGQVTPDRDAISEMLLHHLNGRPITCKEDICHFAFSLADKGYSASDLKVLADEAAKVAMKEKSNISPAHLAAAAAQSEPASEIRTAG